MKIGLPHSALLLIAGCSLIAILAILLIPLPSTVAHTEPLAHDVWPAAIASTAGPLTVTQLYTSYVPIALHNYGALLPVRGLYVQFDRRGWASEYWSGQVISGFNTYDPVVGRTIAEEVAAQLDAMRQMGVNTIAFELRAAPIPPGIPAPTSRRSAISGRPWAYNGRSRRRKR